MLYAQFRFWYSHTLIAIVRVGDSMKYLLSEEEFQALVPRKDLLDMEYAMLRVRRLLLKLAKFRCIHDSVAPSYPWHPTEFDIATMSSYCDKCPLNASELEGASHLVCTKERRYSK